MCLAQRHHCHSSVIEPKDLYGGESRVISTDPWQYHTNIKVYLYPPPPPPKKKKL